MEPLYTCLEHYRSPILGLGGDVVMCSVFFCLNSTVNLSLHHACYDIAKVKALHSIWSISLHYAYDAMCYSYYAE